MRAGCAQDALSGVCRQLAHFPCAAFGSIAAVDMFAACTHYASYSLRHDPSHAETLLPPSNQPRSCYTAATASTPRRCSHP